MYQNWCGYKIVSSCNCAPDTSGVVEHPSLKIRFCKHKLVHEFNPKSRDTFREYKYEGPAFKYTYLVDKKMYEEHNLQSVDATILFHYILHCSIQAMPDDSEYRHDLMKKFIDYHYKGGDSKTVEDIEKKVKNMDKKWSTRWKKRYKERYSLSKYVECARVERRTKSLIGRPKSVNYNRRRAVKDSDQKALQKSRQIAQMAAVLVLYRAGCKYVKTFPINHTSVYKLVSRVVDPFVIGFVSFLLYHK